MIYQNKFYLLSITLVLLAILIAPTGAKSAGQLFSSQLTVSWDDNGPQSASKRAYISLDAGSNKLEYVPTGNPSFSGTYGCRKNSNNDFLVDNGVNAAYPKGWYKMLQPSSYASTDFKWGAATVSWGTDKPYERNCDYGYMYLAASILPTANAQVLIEGDVFAQGDIVGQNQLDPNKQYLAVAESSLIESKNQISGFDQSSATRVGLYTLSDQSTSDKNIINTFRNKLIGSPKSFINEYFNVKYGKTTISNFAKDFYISDINNKLTAKTELAKNPDGDVYVIEGDLTIDDDINLPLNARKLVYVEGNLNIKANIIGPKGYVKTGSTNWEQLTAENDSAVLAFVVEGDITVDGSAKDVEFIHAGLIAIGDPNNPNKGGAITFNHADSSCSTPNSCFRLEIDKGIVIGKTVEFNRDPTKITFDSSWQLIHAGVRIKYNPNIAKLPAFDQLLSAPAIDEASP